MVNTFRLRLRLFLPKHTAMILCLRCTKDIRNMGGTRIKDTRPLFIAKPYPNLELLPFIARVLNYLRRSCRLILTKKYELKPVGHNEPSGFENLKTNSNIQRRISIFEEIVEVNHRLD